MTELGRVETGEVDSGVERALNTGVGFLRCEEANASHVDVTKRFCVSLSSCERGVRRGRDRGKEREGMRKRGEERGREWGREQGREGRRMVREKEWGTERGNRKEDRFISGLTQRKTYSLK